MFDLPILVAIEDRAASAESSAFNLSMKRGVAASSRWRSHNDEGTRLSLVSNTSKGFKEWEAYGKVEVVTGKSHVLL